MPTQRHEVTQPHVATLLAWVASGHIAKPETLRASVSQAAEFRGALRSAEVNIVSCVTRGTARARVAWLILLLGYLGYGYPVQGGEARNADIGSVAGLVCPDAGDGGGAGLCEGGPEPAADATLAVEGEAEPEVETDDGVDGEALALGWVVAGEWPTYGFAAAQTRSKVNPDAFPDPDPAPAWTLALPVARHTMFYSSATSGPDGTLYIPFFGIWDYYPSGGIQAVSAAGEPRWYFASRETEAQSPLVARDRATGETVVIFGSAGRPYGAPLEPDPSRHYPSMMAVYDRPDCRCCVNRDDATSFCEFTCVPDELCEPYDPESPYEWRHTGHVDPVTRQAVCDQVNPECAAWLLSADALDPARVPASPWFGYYEQCGTPLLAPDGQTVYYSLCGVDILVNLTNLVVAVDVEQKAVRWILTEDDPEGWDRGECASGHNQFGWIESTAMLSDGSLLYGTRAGCLVRVVDHGDHGATEGLYHGPHPSVVGLAVEPGAEGDDFIYVATHGQVRQQPGDLYKTARSRLTAQGALHEPIWVWPVGKVLAPTDWQQDAPGLYGSPVVVTTGWGTTVYAVAGDWPDQGPSTWLNPDRGWVVKVAGSGPDGSVAQLPLRLGDNWYPAYNCTVDGRGNLWLHGGLDRAVDGSGRILRVDADFSGPVGITAGVTSRFGFAEIILDRGGLYAISAASWDGDHDDVSPIVYRFGDEAGLPPPPRRPRGRVLPQEQGRATGTGEQVGSGRTTSLAAAAQQELATGTPFGQPP